MITKEGYKRLLHFLVWCIVAFIVAIIGISNVFADNYNTTYADIQQYWDNNGSSVSAVSSTWNSSLQSYVSGNITTIQNSYGAGVSFNSPIPIIANHTYTVSIPFEQITYNLATSSKNNISLGGSLNGSASNYANGNYNCSTQYIGINNGKTIQFAFKANSNQLYIFVPWTTNTTQSQSYFFNKIIISDLGDSGISQQEINNSLNNQTNIINNSISNSTNTITENSNNNRQAIIDNQNANNDALIENDNANTNKIIEENKKTFNDCRDSVNLLNPSFLDNVAVSGNITYHHIQVENGTYTLSTNMPQTDENSANIFLLAGNVSSGASTGTNGVWNTQTRTVNITNGYLTIGYRNYRNVNPKNYNNQLQKGSTATDYESYGEEICVNKLDEQKNAINNLDDTLKDDSVDENGVADAFESFNDYLDDNSTITQLITLPITLYTAILNNLNGTCQPFNLGKLYGEDLILPCINISQYLGNSLWTMIDIIISGFAVYAISKKMIKVFNNFSSLREGDVIDD